MEKDTRIIQPNVDLQKCMRYKNLGKKLPVNCSVNEHQSPKDEICRKLH